MQCSLSQDVVDYVTVYVGESEISAGEAIGELLMVESKAVKDRGVKVMVVNLVLNGSESKIVRGTVNTASFDTPTRQ